MREKIDEFSYGWLDMNAKFRIIQIIPAPETLWAVFRSKEGHLVEKVICLALAELVEEKDIGWAVTDRIVVGLIAGAGDYPLIDICESYPNFIGYIIAENEEEACKSARQLEELEKVAKNKKTKKE